MATGTYPTATMSSTTLATSIPLIWGDKINEFFKLKLMIADFFIDRSSELAGGGSALYTPNLTEFAAAAKSNATAVTLNNATDTKVTLTVDQWYEVSFAIEDREAAQVKHSYYLQERYAQGAGYTIAKKLEVALAALLATFSTTVGASTTALADSEIRAAIAALQNVGIDTTSDVAFFVHPNTLIKASSASDSRKQTIEIAGTPQEGNLQPSPYYVRHNIVWEGSETIIIASH